MTTESAPRIKITYATLRNDNEELHAAYRGRPREGAGRASAATTATSSTARSATATGRSSCARPSIATSSSGRSPRARRQDVRDAIAAARAAQPAWAAAPGRSGWPILRRAADLISERQMEYGGADGDRGRQEPARGARRGRGGGRPHPLLRARRPRTTTSTTTRWTTSATPPSTPARSCGRTACSPSSARSTSRWRSSAGPSAARHDGRQHRRLQARQRRRHERRHADRGLSRRGRARRRLQPRHGAGRHGRRRAAARTRASTASCSPARTRSAWTSSGRSRRATRGRASSRWAARTRPSSARSADLEEAAEGIMRSRLRLRRPEVLGQQPRLRRAPGPRRARAPAGREDRDDHHRRPARARATGWARSSTRRAVDRHQQAVAEARRDGRSSPAASASTDGDLARGYYVEPTVVGGLPASHRLFRDELFAPVHRRRAGRLAGRGARPRQRHGLRPDGRRLQRGPGRGRSASSTASRPACCTSTGAPARRPAPGRASRPFGGWKGSGSTGKAGRWRCTTSRSSCASRPTPSSTEAGCYTRDAIQPA